MFPLRPGRAVTLRYDRARMWSVVLLRLTHNPHGARRSPARPGHRPELALTTRILCCSMLRVTHERSAHVRISDTVRRVGVFCRRLSLVVLRPGLSWWRLVGRRLSTYT